MLSWAHKMHTFKANVNQQKQKNPELKQVIG